MQKLSKVITPFHKDLRIPKIYHYECPWPAAQKQIYMINVYKARYVLSLCTGILVVVVINTEHNVHNIVIVKNL